MKAKVTVFNFDIVLDNFAIEFALMAKLTIKHV